MADTAARLVDSVLPDVPVRQWVLSTPFALRFRLACDAALTSALLAILIEEVTRRYRELARERGYDDARCGASRRARGPCRARCRRGGVVRAAANRTTPGRQIAHGTRCKYPIS
jgi:hypothetical protein